MKIMIEEVIVLVKSLVNPRFRDLITEDVALFESKLMDSFGLVQLVAEIETRLNIAIPTEDLTIENFSTVKTIAALGDRYRIKGN